MSESTHKLKIIPQLDTSQLQGQLNQINQQRAAGSSGSAATGQNPNAAFSSLDRTLQSLNRTLQQLARLFVQSNTSTSNINLGSSTSNNISGNFVMSLAQQRDRAFNRAFPNFENTAQAAKIFQQFGYPAPTRAGFEKDYAQAAGMWKKIPPNFRWNLRRMGYTPFSIFQWQADLKHGMESGMLDTRSVYNMNSVQTLGQIPRNLAEFKDIALLDQAARKQGAIPPNTTTAMSMYRMFGESYNNMREYRKQLSAYRAERNRIARQNALHRNLKYGAITHMAGSYIGQIGGIAEEAGYYGTSTGLGIAGAAMAGAGMGGAVAGPWGAAVGGLASAALECVKALQEFKRVTEENAATFTKFNQVERNRLDFADISKTSDFMQLMPGSTFSQILQDRIARQEEYRDEAASQILLAASSTTMNAKEKAQALKAQQNIYQQAIQQLQVLNQMLDAANKKSDELFEEQRQIRWIEQGAHDEWMSNIAEQQEEAASRRHVAMLDYQSYRTANRQAYRSAMSSYRQGIANRDMWLADQQTSMEQESLVAGISGYWRTGNMSDYLDKAKQARQRMKQLVSEISTTGDLTKVAELQQQYQRQSTAFSNAMTVANMLKPEGNPLQRIALENLTSMAGRGGWMGEKYNTDRTFEKLNEMASSLRNIDDNTREQFKSVYD